jgi:PIN domain nuclease of toxin-antitoxin system
LALLLNEPGGQRVGKVVDGALLSTVNLAEVHARLLKRGESSGIAWKKISELQCEICNFTPEQARMAGDLILVTQPYGLSLGDRACLSLAIERKATVYTTDRAWKNLALGIEIEVIR